MSKKDAEILLKKYQEGTATPEETAIIESWLLDYIKNSAVIPTEKEMLDADKSIGAGLIYKNPGKDLS